MGCAHLSSCKHPEIACVIQKQAQGTAILLAAPSKTTHSSRKTPLLKGLCSTGLAVTLNSSGLHLQ